MRSLPLGLLLVLALLPGPALVAGGPTGRPVVVVGGDAEYPPFEFLDKAGKPAGFNVELAKAIAEIMDFQVEIKLGDFSDQRKALERGSIQVLGGVSFSSERTRVFDCSDATCIVRQSVFARRGSPQVQSLKDLEGKDVIVQRGGFMHDQIRADSVAANLVLVDTHAAALRLLASGKGDYAIVNTLTGLYSGLELGLTNLVPMGEPVAEVPYGFAFHKGDAALQAKFNQGLAILRNTGRYQQIYGKWLGILEPQTSPWRKAFKYALASLVPLLAIIGAMVVWSWSLRKKIAQYIAVAEARQQELIQSDKLASLGILVSGVAHEINNPTGLILYDLPILQSAYRVAEDEFERHYQEEGDFLIGGLHYSELREEIPRMFDEMLGGARRIRRIVDDLKDFARKDTSSLEEVADLNHVAQAAVRLVDNSIRKATIRFRASYCEGPLPFRGNAQRIEQVVVNLVLNACQALRRPEDSISLSTHRDLRTGDLKLIVEDEGVGIALEHLPHLMDPFFTTRREVGGTGLGLSVSAGIVKDHHGRLEFDSVQGERTTVTLILPTLEAQAHA